MKGKPQRVFVSMLLLVSFFLSVGLFFWALTFPGEDTYERTLTKEPGIPEIYLIPQDYVGEVVIEYGIRGAPPLPVKDGLRHFVIPTNGRLQTSSLLQTGRIPVPEGGSYYYVDNEGVRTPLRLFIPRRDDSMIWSPSVGYRDPTYILKTFVVGTDQQLEDTGLKYGPRRDSIVFSAKELFRERPTNYEEVGGWFAPSLPITACILKRDPPVRIPYRHKFLCRETATYA